MTFTVRIECDNIAQAIRSFTLFQSMNEEVARLLREAASRLENGESCGGLRDANGNSVGGYEYA